MSEDGRDPGISSAFSGVRDGGHTPGPWEARRAVQPDNVGGYDYAIIAPGKAILAEAFEIVGDGDARPVEANARLMAAGPDLLAALQSAVSIAEEAQREWDAAPSGMRAGKILIALAGGCPGYRSDIDAVHAAIAKALGGAE